MHQARRDGMDIDIRDIPGPLELTAKAHENGPKRPKRKPDRIPTIHFQVRTASFRGCIGKNLNLEAL